MRPTTAALILAPLTLLLGACASRSIRDEAPRVVPIKVEYSTSLADFELTERTPDANPFIGDKLRYQSATHPELVTDVFVYVAGIHPDADTAAGDMVAMMNHDLEQAQAQGLTSGLEFLGERRYAVTTRYGANDGVHLRYAFRRNNDGYISHAHLFYLPPYTIKFRSSFPWYGNTSFDEQIDALVPAFMADVAIDLSVLCRRDITVHGSHLDTPWVSLDGHDLFLTQATSDEQIAQMIITAMQRWSWHAVPCDRGAAP